MHKSNSGLIANLNQAVTAASNRIHELQDVAGRVNTAQIERDELASAIDNATVQLNVAAAG